MTALAAALAMFTATIAFAPPARAAACGDLVTADLTLTANMVCDGTPGLIVGASNITIDLNGFVIRNIGGGVVSGIETLGHDNVTVRNGTVRDFYKNIVFENVANAVAEDLTLRGGGGYGLIMWTVRDASAARVDARDFPDAAVSVADSTNVALSEITARRASWGVLIGNSIGTIVDNSDLRRSFYGALAYLSHGTTISNSVIRNNSVGGVVSEGATKTTVIASDIRGNGIGAHFLIGSDGSAVLDSVIAGNGIGVLLGTLGSPVPDPATNVRILRNTIRNNDGSGVVVDQATTYFIPHRIADNQIVGNGFAAGGLVDSAGELLDDGIHVLAPAGETELGANKANSNADFGIYAPGATDLGGNAASGNGNPAQCSGVSC